MWVWTHKSIELKSCFFGLEYYNNVIACPFNDMESYFLTYTAKILSILQFRANIWIFGIKR